ncbi:MAG: zinc metallopeptidase [Chitinophagales bacterium]|nr:zinc metallopeptidase [Chitinophagales bacterium]MDW8418042.1 zinc metallopeptidase [Chitinophagales bacterium]
MIYVIIFGFLAISWLIGWRLRSKFREYSQIPFRGNLTGAQVAQKMLHDNGIYDVKIQSVEGELTDHYNPITKTVNLSPEVYSGRSVAAAAVAAHECGHAVQHARAYQWLMMRSRLVPAVSFASRWVQWIILAGALLLAVQPYLGFWVIVFGIALFALTTLFAFITLPVEFDASRRALEWLNSANMTTSQENALAYDALKWAAMTYVVAALQSLVMLLYYIYVYLLRDRR